MITLPEAIRLAIEAEKLANAYAACWPVDTQVKADTILGCAAALRSTHAEAEKLRARVAELESKHMQWIDQNGRLLAQRSAMANEIQRLESKLAEAGKDAAWNRDIVSTITAHLELAGFPPGSSVLHSLSRLRLGDAIAAKEQ